MYPSYYQFTCSPFRLINEDAIYFDSQVHETCLAQLVDAIQNPNQLVIFTGSQGAGKTTLLNKSIKASPAKRVIYIDLVKTPDVIGCISQALSRSTDNSFDIELIEQIDKSSRYLFAIDEAQKISLEAIESIIKFLDIASEHKFELQFVLVGNKYLEESVLSILNKNKKDIELKRISLSNLTEQETLNYILYRLKNAGWINNPKLDDAIFGLIHHFSGGLPRRINAFCDRLFLYAFLHGFNHITVSVVNACINDIKKELSQTTDFSLETNELLQCFDVKPQHDYNFETVSLDEIVNLVLTSDDNPSRYKNLFDGNYSLSINILPLIQLLDNYHELALTADNYKIDVLEFEKKSFKFLQRLIFSANIDSNRYLAASNTSSPTVLQKNYELLYKLSLSDTGKEIWPSNIASVLRSASQIHNLSSEFEEQFIIDKTEDIPILQSNVTELDETQNKSSEKDNKELVDSSDAISLANKKNGMGNQEKKIEKTDVEMPKVVIVKNNFEHPELVHTGKKGLAKKNSNFLPIASVGLAAGFSISMLYVLLTDSNFVTQSKNDPVIATQIKPKESNVPIIISTKENRNLIMLNEIKIAENQLEKNNESSKTLVAGDEILKNRIDPVVQSVSVEPVSLTESVSSNVQVESLKASTSKQDTADSIEKHALNLEDNKIDKELIKNKNINDEPKISNVDTLPVEQVVLESSEGADNISDINETVPTIKSNIEDNDSMLANKSSPEIVVIKDEDTTPDENTLPVSNAVENVSIENTLADNPIVKSEQNTRVERLIQKIEIETESTGITASNDTQLMTSNAQFQQGVIVEDGDNVNNANLMQASLVSSNEINSNFEIQEPKIADEIDRAFITQTTPINVPAPIQQSVNAKPKIEPNLVNDYEDLEYSIEEDDLFDIVFDIENSFEDGSISEFLELFDDNIVTNKSESKEELEAIYSEIFESSIARKIEISNVNWNISGDMAQGKGEFRRLIKMNGSITHSKLVGNIILEVNKNDEGMFVRSMIFEYDVASN